MNIGTAIAAATIAKPVVDEMYKVFCEIIAVWIILFRRLML